MKRQLPGTSTYDSGLIKGLTFNAAAGGIKTAEVGRKLVPLDDGASGFTTNAATIKRLPSAGRNLAVYNNAGALGSVVVSTSATQASLASGVTDSNGNVGIPCMPNSWTYIAAKDALYVISSASTIMVFLIDDDTYLR